MKGEGYKLNIGINEIAFQFKPKKCRSICLIIVHRRIGQIKKFFFHILDLKNECPGLEQTIERGIPALRKRCRKIFITLFLAVSVSNT